MLQINKEKQSENNIPQKNNNISQELNTATNYKNHHIDTSPSNKETLISNQNNRIIININSSTKDNTMNSTLAQPYKKKLMKSSNSNNSSKINNNNLDNIQDNKNNENNLEPIMEAPPLEKIIKREDLYEFYINDPEKNTVELFFKNNKISTTKYNAFTFLPKALLYQFIRLANVYFVFMAVLQSISLISPLSPTTAIAPLVFVLAVSLIREAVEDLKRRKLDNEQNSNEVETYINGTWMKIQSGNLQMGEIVRVKKDGVFPSDLLLIDSNLKDGICFIETGTLDGEKTLKIKNAPNFTKGKFSSIINEINDNQIIDEDAKIPLQKSTDAL